MRRKQIILSGVALAVLAVLVYLQFRTWKNFDWATFWSQTGQVREHKLHIAAGLALIYLGYLIRALRWKIFLRPVQSIGFTGLALFGRPGEFIRPYLIARKTSLSFSSQIAVWAVERIFDVGSFALLLISAIFLAEAPTHLAYYGRFRQGGFAIVALVFALIAGASLVYWRGEAAAAWIEHRFRHSSSGPLKLVTLRIREFRSGLNTIHDFSSLLQLVGVSLAMWTMIALSYWEVMQSYGPGPLDRPLSEVPLLMATSMVGSLIQLPGVGGGSQLATIGTLQHVFQASHELAASCGILLWLVTFFSVVPWGLFLAHRSRLSLRQLSAQSQEAEANAEPSS